MPKISEIPGISDSAAELLRAAGYPEVADLAATGAERLHAELLRMHKAAGRSGPPIELQLVREWVLAAAQLLASGPLALPLSGRVLGERGIPLAEVPLGILPGAPAASRGPLAPNLTITRGLGLPERTPLDQSRVRSVSELKTPAQRAREEAEARRTPPNLLKVTRTETNQGVSPSSRRYIRGVLHPHRIRMVLGALITVAFILLLPVSVVAVVLLLAPDMLGGGVEWVPQWLVAFPACLLAVGMLYLLIAARMKCRVCAQRLLVPKNCRKNNKAHHARGLGYILPLSLHLLAFRWFRCTFCGTAVRLKE